MVFILCVAPMSGCRFESSIDEMYDDIAQEHFLYGESMITEFSDQVIINIDASFECGVYPVVSIEFDKNKQYYTVSRTNDTDSGYSLELWLYDEDTLSVKNVCIEQEKVSENAILDRHSATLLADIILSAVYERKMDEPIEQTYPDLSVYETGDGEWEVVRSEGENTDGSSMSIKVDPDGKFHTLTWGGE